MHFCKCALTALLAVIAVSTFAATFAVHESTIQMNRSLALGTAILLLSVAMPRRSTFLKGEPPVYCLLVGLQWACGIIAGLLVVATIIAPNDPVPKFSLALTGIWATFLVLGRKLYPKAGSLETPTMERIEVTGLEQVLREMSSERALQAPYEIKVPQKTK